MCDHWRRILTVPGSADPQVGWQPCLYQTHFQILSLLYLTKCICNILEYTILLLPQYVVQWLVHLTWVWSWSSPSCSSSQMGWLINGYLGKPGEGKLWKLGCHSGPVSWSNGLISTKGSKADVTGNEHPQLQRVPTLDITLLPQQQQLLLIQLWYSTTPMIISASTWA